MLLAIEDILQNPPEFSRLSVFTALKIPPVKIRNAVSTYCGEGTKFDDVLILIDDTVFGSAKEGMCVTEHLFFFKTTYNGTGWGSLDNIEKIESDGKYLLIYDNTDDHWEIKFDLSTSKDISNLADYLTRLIQIIRTERQRIIDENQRKYEEEQQRQLMEQQRLQKEQEHKNQALVRQQKIKSAFNGEASDEITSRVNKLFEELKELETLFGSLLLSEGCRSFRVTLWEFPTGLSQFLFPIEIYLNYKKVVDEYHKMRAVLGIIETNKDELLYKLNIINGYINDFECYSKLSLSTIKSILKKDITDEIICTLDIHTIEKISIELYNSVDNESNYSSDDLNYSYAVECVKIAKEMSKLPSIEDELKQNIEYDDYNGENGEETSQANSALSNFLSSNSDGIIAKLKNSGLQLSAVALQNDENISRIANVVYNVLPAPVRIFVSFSTVENFLLENRQWLINKLN